MSLRRKTLAAGITLTISLIVLLYAVSHLILLGSFSRLEDENTRRNVARAQDALASTLSYMDNTAKDWANWDDTYAFMAGEKEDYLTTNLVDETFDDLVINLIFFRDCSGKVFFGKAFDLESGLAGPLPEGLQPHLAEGGILDCPAEIDTHVTGVLILPEGPLMLAARPIVTSDRSGPIRGMLVFGRFLDAVEMTRLSDVTHLSLYYQDLASLPDRLPGEVWVWPKDSETVAGAGLVKDVYGKPAFALRVELSREIYAQGRASLFYLILSILMVGIAFSALIFTLLERWILSRLEQLSRHVQQISADDRQDEQPTQDPGDELTQLAGAVAALERRVQQRTAELAASRDQLAKTNLDLQDEIVVRRRVEEQLRHDAFHDTLTGLPNRALFLDRLGQAIERSRRYSENTFSVLFLDLDCFKVINDSLGHFIGDQLLISVAKRLSMCLRAMDTAARLGGDEFAILIEDLQEEACSEKNSGPSVLQIAERLQSELSLPFNLNGYEVVPTTSIGIVHGVGYEQPDDVLRDADTALYQAKALGRGRYAVFDASLRRRAVARLELESELRAALERGEFELHYQPIQLLETGRIVSFEALLRWNSPGRGMVLPAEFIPVAEESGLIVPIGEWVLGEACRQILKWQEQFRMEPSLAVNVNISGVQFAQPLLFEKIEQVLAGTGLSPHNLRLEITESVFMENAEQAQSVLHRLCDLGVQLQIDDFGTGYSSLAYLHRFPIQTIKIDRSFVSRLGANGAFTLGNDPKNISGNGAGSGTEIVKTIVNLARDLGMEAAAEGVETGEQLTRLRELGCTYGQGFFIARPAEAARAQALLAERFQKQIQKS